MPILPLLIVLTLASHEVQVQACEPDTVRGEALGPGELLPGVLESMDVVRKREREGAVEDRLATPPPQVPPGWPVNKPKPGGAGGAGTNLPLGGGGTSPVLGLSYPGPNSSDPGAGWVPPDTVGATGTTHIVAAVNKHLSAYVKATGQRVLSVSLASFFGVAVGDPRVACDPHTGRFIVLGSDFGTRIYVAVSASSDPTGSWFKFGMIVSAGSDAGFWPDYPTLGVDVNGIYTAAYMVGGNPATMSLFAIDKAPLVAPVQSQGTVTAFRGLAWEGAIHPCVTHGTPAGEYCVSRASSTSLRLRRVNPPLTAPTLTNLGTIGGLPSTSTPPDAPSQGSPDLLDTLDARPLNAVYRNGSVFTAHGVDVGGLAGCRWYELAVSPMGLAQTGTVDDPVKHYFFPAVAVNSAGDLVVGFSGSSPSHYAGCYATARRASDPAGQTGPPILIKDGEAPYDVGSSPNRWGDYSLSGVDPVDDLTFWTFQEYARAGNTWGTWMAELRVTCPAPTSFCIAAANTFDPNGALMGSSGSTSVAANDLVLLTFSVPPLKTCLYFYGQDQTALAVFGNGWRCINSPLYRLPVTQSNLLGDALWNVDLNALPAGGQISAGQSWGFQCWYRNPEAGGANFNASDGLSTIWCP